MAMNHNETKDPSREQFPTPEELRRIPRGDRPMPPRYGHRRHPMDGQPPYGMKGPGPMAEDRRMPPPPPLEDQGADGHLLNLLRMTGHLALTRPGLRSGQYRLLSVLADGSARPQRQISELLKIQPGSLSELVAKLEQAKAVVRQRSDEDRRAILVQITQTGLARLQHMQQSLDIDRSELLCALTDEEKAKLTELLQKLLESNAPRSMRLHRPGDDEGQEADS